MSDPGALPYRADLEEYEEAARALFEGWERGDEPSLWRFKWEHPGFRGRSVKDVRVAALALPDAKMVIAREYGFDSWPDLVDFTEAVKGHPAVRQFEAAVEAVVSGDVAVLRSMLREHPQLAHARSSRRHRATLLHYVAANGVEGGRQKTPETAIEVAQTLLDAGAEVDALADMYDAKCTTMSLLVSSCHPAEAGLQGRLAELLVDRGAALDGPGTNWQSAVVTALAFGYRDTAETLAARKTIWNDLRVVAGLGRLAEVERLLPSADGPSRHAALALAAQHGNTDVVRLLLDAGEDPNRYNPEGFHSHSTPLHQAVSGGHEDVVRLLVERGARLDVRDTVYDATPLGWAEYGGRATIAAYLRQRDAPE